MTMQNITISHKKNDVIPNALCTPSMLTQKERKKERTICDALCFDSIVKNNLYATSLHNSVLSVFIWVCISINYFNKFIFISQFKK
jgi:hypothetical protein